MKRKMISKIMAAALIGTMCAGMAVPVMAADDEKVTLSVINYHVGTDYAAEYYSYLFEAFQQTEEGKNVEFSFEEIPTTDAFNQKIKLLISSGDLPDIVFNGCEADGELVGVIIAGRPVSRYLDDGFTLEVTRLCTNGEKNACSFLYGAAARAAAAMGYKRIITYTLESENGASLRASGWICQGKAGGLRWTGKRQPKEDQYPAQMKLRYEKQLRKEETVNGICSGPEGS